MLSDIHLHSYFSSDSEAAPEDIILKAIELNLPYICFTDHSEFDYEDGLFNLDTTSYFDTLTSLRQKYADRINILIGVEQGLEVTKASKTIPFLDAHTFDFIIGSSHVVNGIDPYYAKYFEGRSTYDGICEYFQSIIDNLNVYDNFDVYGHIDYVIRYPKIPDENYCYDKYADYLDVILKKLIDSGKGIEINTGGFRSKIKDANPSLEILKKYKQYGGEIITVGSDAHKVEDIASHFDKASEYLKESGFDYYNIFVNRKPVRISL